jgi:cyclic pyranopterin monophosphate synthase
VSEPELTHVDESGRARMVDVGAKQPTERSARARARVRMSEQTAAAVRRGDAPKGDVLQVARLAGIQAAKQTPQLIPLSHPLELTYVDVSAALDVAAGVVELVSEVRTRARTGVEMEAMCACAFAALTVYDMVKGIERGVEIEEVALLEKHGGRHDYRRHDDVAGSAAPGDADARRAESEADRGGHERPSAPREPIRAALITISTSKAAGAGVDESGARLAQLADALGGEVVAREILPDDRARIEERLRHWSESGRCSLVLTSGGTGVAPSDVTPEATAAVIERAVPGLAEAIRYASRPHTPNWSLSRGLAGVRGSTLIVNLPGSPASIAETGAALAPALRHAVELLAGRRGGH